MAEPRDRLTNAETALAHALTVLVARRRGDLDRDLTILQIVADVAPHCDERHPQIAALLRAADDLLATGLASQDWPIVQYRAGEALEHFAEWRCGLAQEAWRRETGQ